MKSYFTAFALLGLAAPAFAQAPTEKPDPWLLQYPSGDVTGPATQACIGMFSDDLEADAALLAGGNVFLLYAPARVSSFSKVTGPFASMAKVPLLGGCQAAEGLLASSSTGLKLLQWDSTRELVATTVPGSSAWAGVVELQFVTVGNPVTSWVCGLSSARDVVYYAQWDGASIGGVAGSFGLGSSALTLAALDWDGDSLLDIAIDDGNQVKMFDVGGVGTLLSDGSCAAPQLLRLRNPGGPDSLVWLTDDMLGPDQVMMVIHSADGLAEFEMPIPATGLTVGRFTLADLDGNGLDDLLATRSDAGWGQVLFHQDSGPMTFWFWSPVDDAFFAPELPQVYGTIPSAFPVVAGGDIDGDGDDDLLFAGQPGHANRAQVFFGNGIKEESSGASEGFKAVKPWLWSAHFDDWIWPEVTVGAPDVARLTLSPRQLPLHQTVSSANKIRVTVWGRESATGALTPLHLADTFWAIGLTSFEVQIPLPDGLEAEEVPPRFLVIEVSYVEKYGDTIEQVFPGWTGQIDCVQGIPPPPIDGPTTTGGVNQPQPPPSNPPPIP